MFSMRYTSVYSLSTAYSILAFITSSARFGHKK
nr:MAG TPA: hypothetical protein [Siphoviridae sp. ctza41]